MNMSDKLYHFTMLTAEGKIPSTMIVGEGGWGKSYTVQKILRDKNKKFKYFNTYSTPLALYMTLYENRNSLIIFDDVEGILADSKSVAILKGALWDSGNGKRIISYKSSFMQYAIKPQFEFKGNVIILCNYVDESKPHQRALLTRMNVLRYKLPYEEKINILKSVASTKKIPAEVTGYVLNLVNKFSIFNIRTLIKINEYYNYSKTEWKYLANNEIVRDETLYVIADVMKKHKNVNMQMREFIKRTGLSRATFFRYKKKVSE